MKMAAAEGIWQNTGDPAPWTLFSVIDTKNKKSEYRVQIPYLLSYLSYGKFSGSVKGMNELQKEYTQKYGAGNYIPPVKTTFWSFRIMVATGGIMILMSLIGLYLVWKKKLKTACVT